MQPSWAGKVWATPPIYNQPGSAQDQAKARPRTQDEVDAIEAGEAQRAPRVAIAGLGDGRPDPALADNSPMDYPRGSRDVVLDLRDNEDAPVDEYVPPTPKPATPPAAPPPPRPPAPPAAVPAEEPPLGDGGPRAGALGAFELLSIRPIRNGAAAIAFRFGSGVFEYTADELDGIAGAMTGAARAARIVQF